MKINLIVALDINDGFSKNGQIPWISENFAKEDLKNFKNLTNDNTCIMGRKTYQDISKLTNTVNILPNRDCIVLSNDPSYYISNEILIYDSLTKAIGTADPLKDVFIIGGLSLFNEAFKWKLSNIYVTRINRDYQCDLKFPFNTLMKSYKLSMKASSKLHKDIQYLIYS